MKKLYILFLLCSLVGFSQSTGDVVITEYMNDSDAVSDTVGEWFEIFNTTANPIDLNGWTILDDGSDSYTIMESVIVPSQDYFVLGRGPADTMVNGGVILDFSYGDGVFTLGNSDDEIVLLSPTAVEIDRVNYGGGNGFPDEGAGISLILDPTVSIVSGDNNDGANWCFSSSAYGDGDFGTPGAANDSCVAVCETNLGASDATCDSISSGTTDDTYTATLAFSGAATGETFVVTSTSGTVDLSGGNDPTTDASGVITVTGITEGTDITITVANTADGGLCTLTRDITSPLCLPTGSVDLELRGVMDFTVPSGGSDGKAIHLVATAAIANLSEYGLGSANNGGGTDGEEYTFPVTAVNSGDNILLVRSEAAIEAYFTTAGYNIFDVILVDTGGDAANGNGNDAVELFKLGSVVETFGDINDAVATDWNYLDSWAYKDTLGSVWPTGWSYGGVNCTDGSTTTFDSGCVYPFLSALSNSEFISDELAIYPNPATNGIINIKSQLQGTKDIQLFDIMGRIVMNTKLNSDALDVSSIKTGMYLLRVSIDGRSSVTKLVIK